MSDKTWYWRRFSHRTESGEPKRHVMAVLGDTAETVRKIVVAAALLGAFALATFVVVADARRETVTIEPLLVPKALQERGLDGEVLSRWIRDGIAEIQQKAKTYLLLRDVRLNTDLPIQNVSVPGTEISISALVSMVREALGNERARVVGEAVLLDDGAVRVVLRVPGREPWSGVRPQSQLQELARAAGEFVLRETQPVVLASYLRSLPERGAEYEEALRLAMRSSSLREVASAYNLAGFILSEKGRDQEAIVNYKRATETDPSLANSWNNWGAVLVRMGQNGFALEKYEHATELNPELAPAWNNWGNALRASGKRDEAILKHLRAIEIDRSYAAAWSSLGETYFALQRYEEGLESYLRASELKPDYVPVWINWGRSLAILKRHNESVMKFTQAARLEPDNPVVWNNWGVSLEDWEKPDEAIEKYRRATEVDPNYKLAWENWIDLLRKNGRTSEAEAVEAARALKKPDDVATHSDTAAMALRAIP